MEIAKPSDSDKDFFREVAPVGDERVEVKAMFGNLGAFVHGNMFMGLFGPDIGLRLPDEDAAALRAVEGAGDFGPEGRPMKAYVSVPRAWRDDRATLDAWISKALMYVAAMPPK